MTWAARLGQRAGKARQPDMVSGPGRDRASAHMNQIAFNLSDQSTGSKFTMAVGEQPQQRLENFGVGAVSDTELLAMILQGNGTRPEQAVFLASRLIAEAGSVAGLISWTADDYRRLKGIGRIKGLQLVTIAEIARRMMAPRTTAAPLLNRPELIAAYLAPTVSGLQVEKFYVLCLNRKNRLIKQVELTSGTATATLVNPREVFRTALTIEGGVTTAVALAHNHPSGVCDPSSADITVTKELCAASKTLEITIVDHVIVGRAEVNPNGKNYYSFAEAGML